jgi:hypothetical protein
MTITNMAPDATTVPPPTPTDKLLGWVILAVTLLGTLAVLGIIWLAVREAPVPDVLPQVILTCITGLVALLAGRGKA